MGFPYLFNSQIAIEDCISTAELQKHPPFILKVIQFFETLNVRFGVMLVGPTGSGKTENYRLLQAAMTELRDKGSVDERYQRTHTYILNPKCMKMGELYGEYNLMTNEWSDGLASTLIRQVSELHTNSMRLFSQPVHELWRLFMSV